MNRCELCSRSKRRSSGKRCIHTAAMTIVPTPPMSTAATGPNSAARSPDSNSPSWLEVPVVNECAEQTEPPWPRAQDVARVDRQQRGRAAEQHGEEIQREQPDQQALARDERDP